MKDVNPPVYIVLINFNRWSDTIECLESVLRSDYHNIRVLVVDNASTDDSMQKLVAWASGTLPYQAPLTTTLASLSWPPVQKPLDYTVVAAKEAHQAFNEGGLPAVTLISSPRNQGFSAGNNLALQLLLDSQPNGYAYLINNDMVVSPHAVQALVQTIDKDPKIGAVGGLILDYNQPDVVQIIAGGHMSRSLGMSTVCGVGLHRAEVEVPRSIGYVAGGCLLVRLETLRHVGLLDERYFMYAEDADWGERMRKEGYRLGCAIDAVVWHKGSQTGVALSPFQDYHIVRSTLLFVRKHAPPFMLVAAMYSIIRSLLPKIVGGQWLRARSVIRAYADHTRQLTSAE